MIAKEAPTGPAVPVYSNKFKESVKVGQEYEGGEHIREAACEECDLKFPARNYCCISSLSRVYFLEDYKRGIVK